MYICAKVIHVHLPLGNGDQIVLIMNNVLRRERVKGRRERKRKRKKTKGLIITKYLPMDSDGQNALHLEKQMKRNTINSTDERPTTHPPQATDYRWTTIKSRYSYNYIRLS